MDDIVGLIIVVYFVLFIYVIVRIAAVEFKDNCNRVFWFLLVYFFPVGGIILWFLFGRRHIKKDKE